VHEGDIVVDDQDIFGDGVNVAARLEAESAWGDLYLGPDLIFRSKTAASNSSKTSHDLFVS
jgi:adenylate cyclase